MSQPDRTYLGFVKAVSLKRLRVVTDIGLGHATANQQWDGEMSIGPLTFEPSLDVHRPNFYFERLFDRNNPTWLGTASYVSIHRQGLENLKQGRFYLPHKRCAYLFDCFQEQHNPERSYCVLLEQKDLTIHGLVFLRKCCPSGAPEDAWVMDPYVFEINLDGTCEVEISPTQIGFSLDVRRMLRERAMFIFDDVVVATMLINDPANTFKLEQKLSTSLNRYNRMRRQREPRLEAPITITLDRTRSAEMPDRSASGTSQK